MLYWLLKHVVVGPPTRVLFRPWIEGKDNVPREGGAIIASNHLSVSDSIFLPLMVDRRITFPAKMEYFTTPGVKGWLTRNVLRATGQVPIDRSGGSAAMPALERGLEILRRGELFGIYPEGTRSPDGRLYRGKTGIARLALQADVPIVPVAMVDTDKAQPAGQTIPTIVRVGMRIGKPMYYPEYAGQVENHEVLRRITDDVMRELQRLSGQEYVDEYAAVVKKRLAERARSGLGHAREGLGHGLEQARTNIVEVTDRARANLAQRRAHESTPGSTPGTAPEAEPGPREPDAG
jgi:1-acyl-sn-glycerol-3-phosphate acyltransferase